MSAPTVDLKHYEQGPTGAPVVLLAPSLGTTLAMWDELAEALETSYRVIRFDTRGHGASPVPPGPYTVPQMAADVVALADSLDVGRFAFVGLSLGGAIGQALAIMHGERLNSLTLCCAGPSFGDPEPWRLRAAQVRAEGMGALLEPTRARWFTPEFRESDPGTVERLIGMIASTPPVGYAGCCDALAAYDASSRLGEIGAPTRVIAGAQDPVITPEVARALTAGIPDADLVVIEDASHIANVAQPERFNAAVREHLERTL